MTAHSYERHCPPAASFCVVAAPSSRRCVSTTSESIRGGVTAVLARPLTTHCPPRLPLVHDRRRDNQSDGRFYQTVCPPELKVRTPARTKHLGWYVEFEFWVTQATFQSHVDEPAIAALAKWYGAQPVFSGAVVRRCILDLASSWQSHYPAGWRAGGDGRVTAGRHAP